MRIFLFMLSVSVLVGCARQAVDPKQEQESDLAPIDLLINQPEKLEEGMVWIPGGKFTMGNKDGLADESPENVVWMDGFWMDEFEVTNDQFAEFVNDTGYITIAEQKPKAEDFPGADEADLVPGALVFVISEQGNGWQYVPGANWKHPEGPGSTIEDKGDHPVVQVCWEDAKAYAEWAGKSLPTEAQFEYAARGGLENKNFVWGDVKRPDGHEMANIWQGVFPEENQVEDGFATTAPVRSFPANGYGLYDIAGNVWEWCEDWYSTNAYQNVQSRNPQGPEESLDRDEPSVRKKVMRGGSFLCSDNYCRGYRPSARMKSTPDTGLMHTGFRCVKNIK